MRCGLHMYCVSCLWVWGNTSGVYIVGFDKGFRLYTGYACCGIGYTTIRLIKFDRRNKIQDFIVFGIWTEEIRVVNIQVSNKPKSSSLYRNRMLGFFIWFPSDAKINQSIKYIYVCLQIRLSAQNMISFTRQVLLAKDDAKDFPSSDNYRLRQSYNNIHRIYIYIEICMWCI